MTDLAALPSSLNEAARLCQAVIETPRGSRDKFNYDQDLRAFILKKRLPDGMRFPTDFGFIPSTVAEDGDPLDIMVLADDPLPMGLVVQVRLLGVIEAEQLKAGRMMRNDRLVGVAVISSLFADVGSLGELAPGFRDGLAQFWVDYNRREDGVFRVLRLGGGQAAVKAVKAARL